MAAIDYDVVFTYQAAEPDITTTDVEEPALSTITATIDGGTVTTDDVLRFFVTVEGVTNLTALSWQYTVQAGDDFATGKAFNLSGEIMNTIGGVTPTFSAGKVYKGSDWGFTAA